MKIGTDALVLTRRAAQNGELATFSAGLLSQTYLAATEAKTVKNTFRSVV
jgi:hypothetical protein